MESSRTSLASRTHFEVLGLGLEGQVLGLGLEASSPRKLACPRAEDRPIFEDLRPRGQGQGLDLRGQGLHQNFGCYFVQFRKSRGGCFRMGGGLFSIFHIKSASKAQKACDFAHFTSQWGGSSPPPPPGYATDHIAVTKYNINKLPTYLKKGGRLSEFDQ